MKKFRSLVIICFICTILISFMGRTSVLTANAASQSTRASKTVSIIDLVRLKNFLVGKNVEITISDYNGDNKIDSKDLITVMKILLGIPVEVDWQPNFDIDGFFSEVYKP